MKHSYVFVLLGGMAFSFIANAGVEEGKALFQKKMCFACHGKQGEGKASGPSLQSSTKTKEEMVALWKKGSPPTSPKKMMPVKATEEEFSSLVDYVLTLRKK